MNDTPDAQEELIIRSWNTNAKPWTRAIRSGSIHSRKFATDQGIVDAVSSVLGADLRRVLDLGCGEGWLARALRDQGAMVTGIDVVPELVAEAARLGGGEYHIEDYRAIANREWRCGPFDVAVCNFSLLGKESVDLLLGAVADYLERAGHLVIQTLHPVAACGAYPYQNGWRPGHWQGCSADFSDPAPWYFRTFESWFALLKRSGFDVLECREPTAPEGISPASIIFICKARTQEQTRSLSSCGSAAR
jgi:2-polyprenyl-3-methyl-5-hydroxy-6-metoxy-1,4-benzoquinol methylase